MVTVAADGETSVAPGLALLRVNRNVRSPLTLLSRSSGIVTVLLVSLGLLKVTLPLTPVKLTPSTALPLTLLVA